MRLKCVLGDLKKVKTRASLALLSAPSRCYAGRVSGERKRPASPDISSEKERCPDISNEKKRRQLPTQAGLALLSRCSADRVSGERAGLALLSRCSADRVSGEREQKRPPSPVVSSETKPPPKLPKTRDSLSDGVLYFGCTVRGCDWAQEFRTKPGDVVAKKLAKLLVCDLPDERGRRRISPGHIQNWANDAKTLNVERLAHNNDFGNARRHFYSCTIENDNRYESRKDIPKSSVPAMHRDRRHRVGGDEEFKKLSKDEKKQRHNERASEANNAARKLIEGTWKDPKKRKMSGWKRSDLLQIFRCGDLDGDYENYGKEILRLSSGAGI